MSDHLGVNANGCDACTRDGRRGYCAPLRCYCGHKDCHAADSFFEPKLPDLPTLREAPTSTSWDDRKDSTWIDQM